MQIACKYRSLSRYRSKRSLSLYISLSRYVFFSRFRCTCPFLSDTLCFSLSRLQSTEEKKSKPGQSKRGRGRDGILPHSSSVRFQPLVEVECRRALYWYSSFSTRPDIGEFTRHRMSLAFNMRTMIKVPILAGNVFSTFKWMFSFFNS